MATVWVSLVLLIVCQGVLSDDMSHHRHRHARAHGDEYNLDRLLNRWSSRAPSSSTRATTKPNSLWDDQLASTFSPLDTNTLKDVEEKEREDMEDAEDEAEERSEEEDGFDDQNEQADSYSPWNQRSGETYTSWKFENMGSRKSVDNLFQVYRSGHLKPDGGSKESTAQWEVYRHSKQMAQETLCRVPKPKVIRVSDVYPSTSKLYVPSCTVLHQCGDDTGCCGRVGQRCGPKTTKRVELYFYTTYIVSINSRQKTSSGLEKLPFYNHTECACQDRLEEVMPRDGQSSDFRIEKNTEPMCKCPSEYTVRRLANGSCACDCFDKQRDCIKYKRGKEYFNHADRLCIEMGTCQPPACDYGPYLRNYGRCPKSRHEKFRTWNRYH